MSKILPLRGSMRKRVLASFILGILSLASLSARAAIIVDLTTAGSSGTINGALYEQIDASSTGTGIIDSFAQQSPQGSGTTSQAYNTTVNNVLDNNSADNFNHSITLSQVPTVDRAGTPYRQFLLDVNENAGGGNEFLSMDEIQVFVGGSANNSVSTFTGGLLDHDGTLVYRMDSGMDNWVALNYSLNTGSGSGDMFLLVPDSVFTGFGGSSVVTLYSQFGLQGVNPSGFTGDFGGSAGFEEWAVLEVVPEPSTAFMAAIGLVGVVPQLRRRRACV